MGLVHLCLPLKTTFVTKEETFSTTLKCKTILYLEKSKPTMQYTSKIGILANTETSARKCTLGEKLELPSEINIHICAQTFSHCLYSLHVHI